MLQGRRPKCVRVSRLNDLVAQKKCGASGGIGDGQRIRRDSALRYKNKHKLLFFVTKEGHFFCVSFSFEQKKDSIATLQAFLYSFFLDFFL
jgi:hypothetical protein